MLNGATRNNLESDKTDTPSSVIETPFKGFSSAKPGQSLQGPLEAPGGLLLQGEVQFLSHVVPDFHTRF